MYSGITQGLFPVSHVEKKPGLINYSVTLSSILLEGLKIGASVNVDGVCQTVCEIKNQDVLFAAMAETLKLTTLSELAAGRLVSIERSLYYGQEIGGHELAGHVCGMAAIAAVKPSPNNLSLCFSCPSEWMKYILPKGFIAIDGSSLTVGNTDSKGFFDIHLIPETLRVTNFGNRKVGDRVNIELDKTTQIIVNTVERLAIRLI
ncbi:MAG: riboflavin synthase subunit alpha [Proteobacteria bacterium]|nr:riboflavin synthase subunit alpha [Pseudomonadota bacterium]